jgi:hypothetical protein
MYAMFLLAQFREKRAFPLMTRIGLLPEDDLETLFGDFITGQYGSALASVSDGDLEPIKKIIECDAAYEWARVGALSSLTTLVNAGLKSREEILDYFAVLFNGRLSRTPDNEVVWSFLIVEAIRLYCPDLVSDIERAYADGLVDQTIMSIADVRRVLALDKEAALARLAEDPHRQLIEDTAREYGRWACFQPKEERIEPLDQASPLPDGYSHPFDDPATPYRRSEPKIGRNEPCPCGSGKKYKKCCGN